MRYEKPTVPAVRKAVLAEVYGKVSKAGVVVRRVNGTIYIDLPEGMRTYHWRKFLRSNALIPTFGKRASAAIRFERHSWWENL